MNNTDKALAEIVTRFGQSAPDLWAILVASQRLEAIVFLTVFSAIVVVGIKVMRRLAEDDHTDAGLVWIGGGFATFLIALLVSFLACMAATSLVYPEASALKALTSSRK